MKKICFVAAKSGGHIIPCLTLASQYKKKHSSIKITFISALNKLDYQLTQNHPAINKNFYIKLNNVPYKKFYKLPLFFFQLCWETLKTFLMFIGNRPEKIVSTGSYIAIPVICVGFILRIPIELWELNVVPGKAIKFLSRLATKINICFKETLNYLPNNKCELADYPINYNEQDKCPPLTCLENLNLTHNRKTIFILGGSQGSHELNESIKNLLKNNNDLTTKIQIIHQTGADNPETIKKWYQIYNIPSYVFAYQNNLSLMYNAADLIISRAGAGALAEIKFFEKKAIIIPLKTSYTDHQVSNAYALTKQFPDRFITLETTHHEKLSVILKNNLMF
ncbi:TPA: hypothetical protein DIC20_00575 [Candidatus Dependentiae bacterium]|nr:hypothetical protein [Candidatus Dependentiae bacterium]HCU00180.1 hypothetical protein [Candidatus Dependentiae bacterium]